MTEITMTEDREGRSISSRDALSAIAMRFIDQYFSVSNIIEHNGEERTGGSRGGALGARTPPSVTNKKRLS